LWQKFKTPQNSGNPKTCIKNKRHEVHTPDYKAEGCLRAWRDLSDETDDLFSSEIVFPLVHQGARATAQRSLLAFTSGPKPRKRWRQVMQGGYGRPQTAVSTGRKL